MHERDTEDGRTRTHAAAERRHDPARGPAASWALGLQRSAGNAATAHLVAPRVQRHPEGTALPDEDELASEVQSTVAASASVPVAVKGTPGPPTAPAAGAEAPGGGPEGGAPAEATEAAEAGAAGAETKGTEGAEGGGAEAELPAATGTEAEQRAATAAGTTYTGELAAAGSGRAMSLAGAQAVLQGSFGDVHRIVPGSIQLLADRAACWAKYDEVCIAANITNPATGVLWASGDAQRRTPGLDGFAWGGVVYVNAQTTLVTATAHEILHNNTAAGFRAAVGEAINEGATEHLAKLALRAAGVATSAATTAYPRQVAIVDAIVAFIGEDALKNAYFGGVETLVRAYERARGEAGSFAALKAAAETLDLSRVTPLLQPVPAVAPAQPNTGGVVV